MQGPSEITHPKPAPSVLSPIPVEQAEVRVPVLNIRDVLRVQEHPKGVDLTPLPEGGGKLVLNHLAQWQLLTQDDFSEHANGWVEAVDGALSGKPLGEFRQSCNGSPDTHLGGYCAFSTLAAGKQFGGLPPHSMLRISARVHFIDKWLGEYAYLLVDGNEQWTQAHTHCSKAFLSGCKGIDSCGDNLFHDRLSQQVTVTIPHTADAVNVVFGSSLKGDACTASYAFDDVAIYVR